MPGLDPRDLKMLAALEALLATGSVSAAARRLGLSTPAMSHTLARLREHYGDPLLVRAGRGMVLTPRAEALRPRVGEVLAAAEAVLAPAPAFSPEALEMTAVVRATDYVLLVLGAAVDRIARDEAPGLALRFVPNQVDDAQALRAGEADLAVGIYGDLPPELRTRPLLTDRFVCVVREGHPAAASPLSAEAFAALRHVQVAPRGQPGGYLDDVLTERGLRRQVVRAVPWFHAALTLVASSDAILTVSERLAQRFVGMGLVLLEPPVPLAPYGLSLLWHPRLQEDPGHRYVRDLFLRAADEAAGERHPEARRRLGEGRG